MKDILNREVNENDLVLGMTIGRHSDGIRFGVFNGTSVNWRNGTTSTVCNMYLIENPSEKELGIKQSIIDKVTESNAKAEAIKAKRKEMKRIPTKDLVVGESYDDDRGYGYVYLGKGSVSNSYTGEFLHGYIYVSGRYCKYNEETGYFSSLPSVDVLKNPRKLVAMSERKAVDYVFDKQEFTLKEYSRSSFYCYSKERTLTFKLEGGGKPE